MVELYEGGAYLVGGKELVKDSAEAISAIKSMTGKDVTKEEAKNHPRKNVLMKALGVNEDVEPDIFDCEMDIDSVMLCSDGVTNMLELPQIERVLNSDIDIEDKVVKLVQKCNNRGGIDNISIAYLIREGEEK